MQIKPTAPQSIRQVLDTSFTLFRASWQRVWPFALGGALAAYAGDAYQLFMAGTADAQWLTVAIALLGSILSIAFYSAIYLRQNAIAGGEPVGTETEIAFARLPQLVLMTLATSLIVGAAAIPLGVFMATAKPSPPVMAVGVAVLCMPPLVLAVNLIFGTVTMLVEGHRPVESLKASYHLVKGNWWRTLALLGAGIAVLLVASAVIKAVTMAAGPILAEHESTMTTVFATFLGMVLMGLLVTPYFIALMLAMYYDLKLRKDSAAADAKIVA